MNSGVNGAHGRQSPDPATTGTPDTDRPPRRAGARTTVAAAAGGVVGFAVSAAAYLFLNPFLENSDSWLEEFQGLLWNIVPLGTVIGVVLGGLLAARRA